MATFVPRHVRHLDQVVTEHSSEPARDPGLIQSLWAGSKLPLPDKKLATGGSRISSIMALAVLHSGLGPTEISKFDAHKKRARIERTGPDGPRQGR